MSQLAMHHAVFEHLPLIAFVVDPDMHIVDMNPAAESAFGVARDLIVEQKGGDALNCVNSFETPGGCGTAPACRRCALRGSVERLTSTGQVTSRRPHRFTVWRRDQWETLELNVTTTPVDYEGRRLSLLLLEDQTEIVNLRQIVPICMKCGQVRDGEDYWQRVDAYLSKTYQVGVSHGVCPTCLPAYRREFLGEAADSTDVVA